MAFLQWRRFNFFDKEILKDTDSGQAIDKLKDVDISCCTSGRGQLVFGDGQGQIHFFSRQLQFSLFKAFELDVIHVVQLKENPILVAVGNDEPQTKLSAPLVKLYNVESLDPLGKPSLLRVIRSSVIVDSQVTALAVHESLTVLALGYANGNVLIVKGDLTRERQSNKPRIFEVGSTKITGVAFKTSGKTIILFAVTENEVYSVTLFSHPKDKETALLIDSHGCSNKKCSVMSDSKQDFQFVIGREDAVYFYQRDGRGPCLAFEGDKVLLHWFKSYLIVVGKDEKSTGYHLGVNSQTSESSSSKQSIRNIVTVYDIPNKFIAYYSVFPPVVEVLSEWGSIYVICQDGKMFKLQEKDTQSKLDMLFKKNQYSLAISLAKSQKYDVEGLVDIFRQYGDHLYGKGDHDGAVAQYKKTIGKLEASYVIRKFLDAQRIHNLTDYLQSLHKMGLASADHTTLLLNCYTKLKDIDKLNEFIMTKEQLDFDVEIAMKVCRQAGYFKHALYLAEKHEQHDWYLKIQMEDLKDCDTALEYMKKLDVFEQEDNMKKYGKVLMSHAPDKTATLLKELCSGNSTVRRELPSAQDFIHIFDKNNELLMEFLESIGKIPSQSTDLVFSTLLELYLHSYNHEPHDSKRKTQRQDIIMDMLRNSDTQYNVDQALVLCKINDFKPGILYLYEKSKLYQHILHFHMKNEDFENVIQTCCNFGETDPNLWVQALWFFCKYDRHQKDNIARVLRAIEENNLLSPILVVEIMSKSHTATLDFIKDYIKRYLQKENEQIAEDERLIKQYKDDTEKMRNQIEDLKKNAKVFQVSKCSVCMHQLELPTVHFLCNHSYHQQCFENYSAENDSECPKCLLDNRQVLDIIRSQEQHKDRHEQFHHELEREVDSFSFVADYFGRGVFNKVTYVVDTKASDLQSEKNPFL